MKSYLKISLILLLSISITIFLAPIFAGILPFHLYKIINRIALLVTLSSFYYFREYLGFGNIKSLGYSLNRRWWQLLLVGLILSIISMLIIAFIMLRTSSRFVTPGISFLLWVKYIAIYLLAGILVALIEETFFRGFLMQCLLKDTHLTAALIITNLFYAGVHFLKPHGMPKIEVLTLAVSLKSVLVFFKPLFTRWAEIWPSFLGLFLLGMALSFAYLRTRSLALPIGLHAGWIIGIKLLTAGTDITKPSSFWMGGNPLACPLGWAMLITFLAVLGWHSRVWEKGYNFI